MLRLHYYPGNANLAPHVLLEEMGVKYELALVDRSVNAQTSPEYLKLNPAGRIPVLIDGELVVFETAAIALHLVDTHPNAGLAPAVGSAARARFYQWLMYLTNTVQAEMHPFFYPEQHTTALSGASAVKAKAEARLGDMFALLDRELAARGPYLLGNAYSALDPYLAMLVRWGRSFARPPIETAHVGKLARLVAERPAFVRAMQQEGLAEPYFSVVQKA
ncbi:MAG: glutathione S-transferase family protein [Polyangiales bacterium]